jgi:hypothetical protein
VLRKVVHIPEITPGIEWEHGRLVVSMRMVVVVEKHAVSVHIAEDRIKQSERVSEDKVRVGVFTAERTGRE